MKAHPSALQPPSPLRGGLHCFVGVMTFRADHEFSQDNPEGRTAPEGRSIGRVRDKSAPTGVRVVLFIGIVIRQHDQFVFSAEDRVQSCAVGSEGRFGGGSGSETIYG